MALRLKLTSQTRRTPGMRFLHCLMLVSLLFSQLSLALHHHDDHDTQHQSTEHECGVCSQLNSQEDSINNAQLFFFSSHASSFHHSSPYQYFVTISIIAAQPRAPPAQ